MEPSRLGGPLGGAQLTEFAEDVFAIEGFAALDFRVSGREQLIELAGGEGIRPLLLIQARQGGYDCIVGRSITSALHSDFEHLLGFGAK
jgi:hypothetical protein